MSAAPVHRENSKGWCWISVPCVVFGAIWLVKIGGSDIWWHVRTGRWIAEHHAIPTTDVFSYASAGPLRYTEALAQLFYYGAYAAGGVIGLELFHAACGVVLAALVALRGRRFGVENMGAALGLAGAASFAAAAIKPQIFTYLLFALVLLLLRRIEAGRARLLWLLPPLFLLWGNLHRGGVVGLAALGAAGVAWSLERSKRPLLRPLAVVFVLSAVALLLNSGGAYYYSSTLSLALGRRFASTIAEWQPLSLELVWSHHAALLLLLPLAIYGFSKRRGTTLEFLVSVGVGFMAVRSARLVPLFAIAAAPAAAAGIEALMPSGAQRVRASVKRFALVASGVAVMAGSYTLTVPEGYQGVGVMDGRVPVDAAAFLRAHPPPAELWHSFDLGGYLLFALAPNRRVLIDGRNDTVYSRREFERALRAPADASMLRELMRRYGIQSAVVANVDQRPGRVTPILDDASWRLVYWDDVAAVLVKRSARSQSYIDRWGYDVLTPRTGMQRASAIGTDPEREALAADIQKNVQRAPNSMRAQMLAAMLYRAREDRASFARARSMVVQIAARRGVPAPNL